MGHTTFHPPAMLLLACFSRYPQALSWAREQAVATWGEIAWASELFDFTETSYYRATMGEGLLKQFLVFAPPFDPADLAGIKRTTNGWEVAYAKLAAHPESRPLNLDPGYLTTAKLVLASTKDHAHRIYLGQGIYAEVTLYYMRGAWHARDWTYPDYRRGDFQAFFSLAREGLRERPPEIPGS